MLDKSDDIVRQLNRLANDRNIAPRSRNQLLDAAQHIRDLHQQPSFLKGIDIVQNTAAVLAVIPLSRHGMLLGRRVVGTLFLCEPLDGYFRNRRNQTVAG